MSIRWRRLYAEDSLSAVGAGKEVAAASEYRALEGQVRELQRLLGKYLGERDPARDAGSGPAKKKRLLRGLSPVRDNTP